jgi:serine/threonine protein kinase
VHATQAGAILGTAAYMAPEQARGRKVDRRADIWAFGCVLFEMLTGRRAFGGDDISITLASVLKQFRRRTTMRTRLLTKRACQVGMSALVDAWAMSWRAPAPRR